MFTIPSEKYSNKAPGTQYWIATGAISTLDAFQCLIWSFHSCSFCLVLLYCHKVRCKISHDTAKLHVAPTVIRYRVTETYI